MDTAQRKQLPTVDVIVSNPPYIPEGESESLHLNVRKHEPHIALFVPDNNPLVFYEALAEFGKQRLHPQGFLYVEVNENLGEAVVRLFEHQGYPHVELRKDMQGKNRMVKATSHIVP